MTSAINSGLAGLRAADMRVNAHAQNISNWLTKDYRPLEPVQTSGTDGPIVKIVRPAELSGDFPFVDLEAELVDMSIAKHAYQASAQIIRTAGEMQKTLLDALA